MKKQTYFDAGNYTGNHLHVGHWKAAHTPIIEGIAWVRQDGSIDLFFNDFSSEREMQDLFVGKGYYCEEFMGGHIGTVKTDDKAFIIFEKWVDEVLLPYRNMKPSKE